INIAYLAAARSNSTYPNNNTVYKTTAAGGAWTSVFTIPKNANITTGWGGDPASNRLTHGSPLGFGIDPNDANRVVMCDSALIHITTNGGILWKQIYVDPTGQN